MGMKDNSVSELGSAFNAFNDSLKSLAVTRSLNSASQEIQGLRQQEASDAQIQKRQNELAQQLGQQMIGFGYGAHDVAAAQSTFAPIKPAKPQFTNVMELAAYGTPEQKQSALDFFKQYKPPKEEDPVAAEMKSTKLQEAQDSLKFKTLGNLRKSVNEAESSSRNTMGVLAQKANTLTDLNGLIGNPSEWNKRTSFHIQELATGLDRVFKGGVATETGTHGLMPNDMEMRLSKLREFARSEPTAANQGKFIAMYNDTIQRTNQIVEAQLLGYKKNTLGAIPSIAKKYGDDFPELARTMTGESGHYDPKQGKVVFESDQNEKEIGDAIKTLAQPGKSNDPRALGILQNIETDPHFWATIMRDKKVLNQYRAVKSSLSRFQEQ